MEFVWSAVVTEVVGEDGQVSGVNTASTITSEKGHIRADGVFIYVGHEPNTTYLADVVNLRPSGYVDVRNEVYTNVPGIFAAGDVSDEIYRQLGTSVGAGTRAAMAVEKWLVEHGVEPVGQGAPQQAAPEAAA